MCGMAVLGSLLFTEDLLPAALKPLAISTYTTPATTLFVCLSGIPAFIEYFEQDSTNDRAFFLVQVRAGGALRSPHPFGCGG